MSDNMLKFDQIVALSEQTINSQFSLMLNETIDANIDLTVGPDAGAGIKNAVISAPKIKVDLPGTINSKQVQFVIPFTKGEAVYFDVTGTKHQQDLAGWSMALTVSLTRLAFTDPDVKATAAARSSAQKFLSQSVYTVYAILLDLTNVKYSTAIFLDSDGKPVETGGMVGLLEALINYLRKDGNPFILSINPQRTPDATGIDAFKPTSVMYQTHLYDNKDAPSPFSTYNMLLMNQGHQPPYTPVTLPTFQQPSLVPADPNVDGRMYISKNQFDRGYVEPIILSRLRRAMSFVPSNINFVPSGNGWALNYSDSNQSQNDGHGAYLGEKKFEHRVPPKVGPHVTFATFKLYRSKETKYTFALSPNAAASTGGKMVLSGSGQMSQAQNFYLHVDVVGIVSGWRKIGDASASIPYTVDIDFEAGAEGELTISPHFVPGKMQKHSEEHKPSGVPGDLSQKIIDWSMEIMGIRSISDVMNDQASSISNALHAAFDNMAAFASDSLHSAEEIVVLPGAHSLFFKNIGLDDQLNVQFDLSIKS